MHEENSAADQPSQLLHEPSPIFFGPHGMRAGWGLLIFIILLVVFFFALSHLLSLTHLVPPHAMTNGPGPLTMLLMELVGLLSTLAATWILAKIEDRPFTIYGLSSNRKLTQLATGAVVGLVAITLLVLSLLKLGLLSIDQQLLHGAEALRYAIQWIPAFLAVGFFEELLFRGYLQYTLARGLSGLAPKISQTLNPQAFGFWTAAFLVSFSFGVVHSSNPGESPLGLVTAGLAALVFCFSLWRTGSLWWAIGMHAAWDYGQSFIFGVADSGAMISHRLLATHPVGTPLISGGATGPEGSVLCLPVLVLLILIVHLMQRPNAASYATKMPVPALPPAADSDLPLAS